MSFEIHLKINLRDIGRMFAKYEKSKGKTTNKNNIHIAPKIIPPKASIKRERNLFLKIPSKPAEIIQKIKYP